MVAQRTFARILNGRVKDIGVDDNYELANMIARATYGTDAIAIEVTDIPARIGDRFHDNRFFVIDDNGVETPIDPIPSAEVQLEVLKAQMNYVGMVSGVDINEK